MFLYPLSMTLLDTFRRRLSRRSALGSGGCVLWTGRVGKRGYGVINSIRDRGRSESFYAHRAAWEVDRGSIPSDMTVDHLCRNKLCVNVGHMELVTRQENINRHLDRQNRSRFLCKNGHDKRTVGNWSASRHACLPCERDRSYMRRHGVLRPRDIKQGGPRPGAGRPPASRS